jgi:hypothetical protein
MLCRPLAIALVVLAALPAPRADAGELPVEYSLKAAFISHFIRYVEWPGAADGVVVVAVVGDDPFGPALERALQERPAGSRMASVRRYRTAAELGPCAILFVSRSAMAEWPALRDKMRGQPVLTVGEADGFTAAGGTINFFVDEHRLRFEVNRDAAEDSGLRLSSRLLSLARLTPARVASGGR